MKKYIIQTYGCQMNEHDSEKYHGFLMVWAMRLLIIEKNVI